MKHKQYRREIQTVTITIIVSILSMLIMTMILFEKNNVQEISQKQNILFETPIQALTDSGVAVQQSNLYAYVNTDIKTPEHSGTYRSTYGVGEEIVCVVQFTKTILETENVKMVIRFGTGEYKTLEPTINGSKIEFSYRIQEGDAGILKILQLSGRVIDSDNLGIRITLQQSQDVNNITAETNGPKCTGTSITQIDENTYEMIAKYNKQIYKQEEKTLKEINDTQFGKVLLAYNGKKYDGKGKISNTEAKWEEGEYILKWTYEVAEGDYGQLFLYVDQVYDIATNMQKAIEKDSTYTARMGEYTPAITEVNISSEGHNEYEEALYLNKGDSIQINVTCNSPVNIGKNINNIRLYFRDNKTGDRKNTSKIKAEKVEENKIKITYTVQDELDNCVFESIEFVEGAIEDKVGHPSRPDGRNYSQKRMLIDITSPVVEQLIINNPGIYKASEEISYQVLFSEEVENGEITTRASSSNSETKYTNDSQGWSQIKDAHYTIKNEDNGKLISKIKEGAFQDKAGNPVVLKEIECDNLYADTTSPEIRVTAHDSKTETNEEIIQYDFTLTDNSEEWDIGGIANNSFTREDIEVTNGILEDYTKDDRENIKSIFVRPKNDGKIIVNVEKEKIFDIAGNGNKVTALCNNILSDRTSPQVSSIEKSPNNWTNGDVTIIVNATDSATGIAGYSFNDGEYEKSNIKTISSNISPYTIKIKDNVGNEKTETIEITNIDKEPPTVTLSVEGENIQISADDGSGSGIASCKINGTDIPLTNGEYTYRATENARYTVIATDRAGNVTSKEVNITEVDKEAPQIVDVKMSTKEWTNQNINIKVYATDEGSGIKDYSFDNGTTWQEQDNTNIDNNGLITIKVRDYKNNISTRSILIENIDKDKPELKVTRQENKLQIEVKDEKSGIDKCKINGIEVQLNNGNCTYTAEENGEVTIVVTDKAGNETSEKVNISEIDNDAPQITNIELTPSGWTNQNVNIKIHATDEGSGIKGYSFDNGATWQEQDNITVENNQSLTIKVKDYKENEVTQTISIENIDKEKPELKVLQDKNVLTIEAKDEKSGIAKCEINGTQIELNDGKYTYTAEQNGEVIIKVTDIAGNEATETKTISQAKESIITFTQNGGNYILEKNQKINLEETITITNDEIVKVEYAWTKSKEEPQENEWVESEEKEKLTLRKEVSEEGEYYLHIRTTSKWGNTVKRTSNAYSIENKKTIEIDPSLEIINEQDKNYIILKKETTKEELLSKIQGNNCRVEIKNADNTEKTKERVSTGDIITSPELSDVQYTIIVKGDVDGNGNIDIMDMFQINKHRLEKAELNTIQLLAGDVNKDQKVDINDIFRINKYRRGTIKTF